MRTTLLSVTFLFLALPFFAHAQEIVQDSTAFIKARVVEVSLSELRTVPGTQTQTTYQTIRAQFLEGDKKGEIIELENDYLAMETGDVFYVRVITDAINGTQLFSVAEPYRLPALLTLAGLFLLCLFIFGGKQGIRGLLALIGSLFFISFLLLPGILAGYSPILVSIGVASLIIVLGSYVTHGFNRTTTAAVVGMLVTVAITGLIAHFSVHGAHLSGFGSEEAVYLNFDTGGSIDIVGLLLGSMLIGFLGVLYDAAIGQAVAVEELARAGNYLKPKEIYLRAIRIGREHIGALVNTLAIAYVGVALPLLLLLKVSYTQSLLVTVNQELFATEIIRLLVGSIGIILAVPVTTAVAVWVLAKKEQE
ncbi:YibE/F family protein [Acetobacteraceae bacterium]|nr:YibE/F family protein [Candidatus Parcubacteria bacterium]